MRVHGILFLGAALALAPLPPVIHPAFGAATPTAAITGRVSNAATGAYLHRARIAVRGTGFIAFTDETGTYRLSGIPAGMVTLEFFHTGLDPRSEEAELMPGATLERDIALSSAARHGAGGPALKLDPFRVAESRETDVEAIAINEQRFSPNIKNVISTDTLGDPLGGSVGDFLRFVPGVSAAFGALETEGVLIRGFPGNLSVVSLDGAQLAGANPAGDRTFTPSRVGVNSISRVEVTKVPLPSTPADTMSGSLNLVSKSAFERSRAELRYRAGLSSNQQSFAWRRTANASNRRAYPFFPDISLDATLPLGPRLGLVVTALHSITSFETDSGVTYYRASATGGAASAASPYLYQWSNLAVSRSYERDSLSARLDWRSSRHGVLSFTASATYYKALNWNHQFNPTPGTIATPAVAGGTAMSFSADRTVGATGRGSAPQSFSFSDIDGLTQSGGLRYRYDDGARNLQVNLHRSFSTSGRRDIDKGFFNSVGVALRDPVRVTLSGVGGGRIADFQAWDNRDQPVDLFQLDNYIITGAGSQPRTDIRATITSADVDARIRVPGLPFPASLQTGGLVRSRTNDDRRVGGGGFTYNGLNGSFSAAPYLADVFHGSRRLPYFPEKPAVPWVSPHRVWSAFAANTSLFGQTVTQARATASNNILNSKFLEETTAAAYAQGEARLLDNRFTVIGGARFESTAVRAEGPLQDPNAVFVRTATGAFARTPAGARIRKPEAGAAGSVEEVVLIYAERAARASRAYDGWYPSLHLNFGATADLLVRAAYARTYGRPNFGNIIPNTTVTQDDDLNLNPERVLGRINYTNTGLKPWTADNYDLSVEYYPAGGGVVSAGVFLKEVRDFFGSVVKDVSEQDLALLGLDPRYLGWRLTTQTNVGRARVRGAEVNVRQSLAALGPWGRHVIVFANATRLLLEGDKSADFAGFLPKSVNWGVTLARGRTTAIAKWNYRGEEKGAAYTDLGADAYRYPQARLQLDLSLDYRLNERISLYCNLRNATDGMQEVQAYGPQTPAYAREFNHSRYGRPFTLGVRGSF